MNKLFCVLVFFCSMLSLSCQINSNELLKYWYYRDRLKYFVYPGTEEGASVLMTVRNSNGNGGFIGQYNGAEWGQTRKLNGYYIGLLATEYRLLTNNGQFEDAALTLTELELALDALIRMDKCEDIEPWYRDEFFDGFFIRSDVPAVLSENMTNYLNDGLSMGDYWDYVSEYIKRPGVPFAIDSNVISCPRKYSDARNYFRQNFPSSFDMADYLSWGDQYWSYWKSDKFTSNDEIIGTLMGLALVGKYVDDEVVLNKARDIATRMRNSALINPICTGSYGHPLGISQCFPFIMDYPDLTRILDDNGGNSLGYIYGMKWTCSKINDNWVDPLAAVYGTHLGIADITKDIYGLFVYFLSTLNDPITLFGHTVPSFNRPLYSTLIATSDRTGNWLTPYYAIRTIGNQNNHEAFYLAMWAAINDKDLRKKKYDFPFELLINQLETAPCEGPWKYNWPKDTCSTGWCCEYKFGASIDDQNGLSYNTGVYSGADYMLLYNLACLAFPNGFDYEGQHYSFSNYLNLNNRIINYIYYPVVVPNGMPGNFSTQEVGSQNNPEEIRAISTIETNMTVANEAQVFNATLPDSTILGDVTLKAGENIKLTDGFRVDKGAHFLARIESYGCNDVPYINPAAPLWSENYRGSYYDTLISVPMDQRAPIVYSEDNYEEEDFEMPLWDDYYYMYDTTAVTELAVGVWLNPNPCGNSTTLTLVSESEQFITIELFDMTGQKRATLFEGTADNNLTLDVDMSFYAKGMYQRCRRLEGGEVCEGII